MKLLKILLGLIIAYLIINAFVYLFSLMKATIDEPVLYHTETFCKDTGTKMICKEFNLKDFSKKL